MNNVKRADVPARARTPHNGPLQNRLEGDLCSIDLHVPSTTQRVKGLK